MAPSFIDIIIVDDHPTVRQALAQLLPLKADIRVVAEAASGQEALSAVSSMRADLLLLDFSLPGLSGVPLIRQLKEIAPALPILVLSMECDPHIIETTLDGGAAGYVLKGTRVNILLQGIKAVAAGGTFVDPNVRVVA